MYLCCNFSKKNERNGISRKVFQRKPKACWIHFCRYFRMTSNFTFFPLTRIFLHIKDSFLSFLFVYFTRVLRHREVQATVTQRFTIHVTVTPLGIASFLQETSAFTRLSWRLLLIKYCINKTPFLWHSNVMLMKESKKFFQTNNFSLKLHNEVSVGWI